MQNKSERIADRFSMIDRWKASGKSVSSFCKQEKLSYHMFIYWKRKYSKRLKTKGFIQFDSSDFLPSTSSPCEIIFTNGNRINLSIRPEASYLKELLC